MLLFFTQLYANILSELAVFTPAMFVQGGFFLWLGSYFAKKFESIEGKVFWLLFGLYVLFEILQSKVILYDDMFYVALGMIYTHIGTVISLIKVHVLKINPNIVYCKRRPEPKPFMPTEEELAASRRKEQIANEKRDSEKAFLNKLSKKLDAF